MKLPLRSADAYHDFVGEEVGERREAPVANVSLRVDAEVLKPHFYCRIVNPNSAKTNTDREYALDNEMVSDACAEYFPSASGSFFFPEGIKVSEMVAE